MAIITVVLAVVLGGKGGLAQIRTPAPPTLITCSVIDRMGIGLDIGTPLITTGSLFGKPSLKIGTKAFACQFRDGVAFKLSPDVHAEALGLAGAELFDPSGKGRPMKEWVQIPVDHAQRWLEFARQALQYVRG